MFPDKRIIILITSLLMTLTCAASDDRPYPRIGNFALPDSQQPGPLIGFGENILPQHDTQLFLFADDYAGVNKHFIDLVPSVVYGITNSLSIFINAPYAASYQEGPQKSSGFEDAFAQLEYAFFNASRSTYVDQATIVANVTIPTGSIDKTPETGVGSPSFFLGTTFNRTMIEWFFFGSPGIEFTTAKNGTKFGNSYLYQFGFGRHIANVNQWLFAWMLEIDGTYTQKNRVRGSIDPDSGGNVVYATPSIWASTKKFTFQFGLGLPVTQDLFGTQTKDSYLLALNVGWNMD